MGRTEDRHIDLELMRHLVPFLEAGRRGLERSRWMPGQSADDLVAPIVLAVLAEVARTLNLSAMQPEQVPTGQHHRGRS
jgi:hypothetical protein